MMQKYCFGKPFETNATVQNLAISDNSALKRFSLKQEGKYIVFKAKLKKRDAVYGLGEQVRGINKRGWTYRSYNEDDPTITETRHSLYGSHNFILVNSSDVFGAFFDFADEVIFDIGYTDTEVLTVKCKGAGYLFVIENCGLIETVKEFRSLIGTSYIPPKWAFGIGQSRWGYGSADDIRKVAKGYEKENFPLDMIYMDIDYMKEYEDFTVDEKKFPDFKGLVSEMKSKGIRLVPIVDAAVKVKDDYDAYVDGIKKDVFCKDIDGKPFVGGVWPGDSVLPDVLSNKGASWFGEKYKFYLDNGIEGFWNDMNEPVLFYSKKRLIEALSKLSKAKSELTINEFWDIKGAIPSLQNNIEDYKDFYHEINGNLVRHDKVHNLYGYNLTKCAAEYFKKYDPNKRYLLFSRSSYIGMHRYAGIWTGDNCSWWSHLLLNLQMLPSLNMCGFLYCGADVGGFGADTSEDLLLRWMALAAFTPLYRNHSSLGTKNQEPYAFSSPKKFRALLQYRHMLLPFVYSEFVKCALSGDMLFKPLSFVYPDDRKTLSVEDQLIMGDSIMICPVYTQNAEGRCVYLPEDMLEIKFTPAKIITSKRKKGYRFVNVATDEICVYLRPEKVLPIAKPQMRVVDVDFTDLEFIKNITQKTVYTLACDDGETTEDLSKYLKDIVLEP